VRRQASHRVCRRTFTCDDGGDVDDEQREQERQQILIEVAACDAGGCDSEMLEVIVQRIILTEGARR